MMVIYIPAMGIIPILAWVTGGEKTVTKRFMLIPLLIISFIFGVVIPAVFYSAGIFTIVLNFMDKASYPWIYVVIGGLLCLWFASPKGETNAIAMLCSIVSYGLFMTIMKSFGRGIDDLGQSIIDRVIGIMVLVFIIGSVVAFIIWFINKMKTKLSPSLRWIIVIVFVAISVLITITFVKLAPFVQIFPFNIDFTFSKHGASLNTSVDHFSNSIKENSEAARIFNEALPEFGSGTVEADKEDDIMRHNIQALEEARKVDIYELNKAYPGWGKHYAEEFIQGIEMYISGRDTSNSWMDLKGQLLLNKWGDWYDANIAQLRKAIK